MTALRSLLSGVLDLFYPPRCVFCRKLLDRSGEGICPACRKTLPFTENGGLRSGEVFTFCASPLYFTGTVRESLLRYKFGGADFYAKTYGPLLADCIRDYVGSGYDLLSWVPLSRKRLRERGYDQARLLAESAARQLGTQAVPLLEKRLHTARQSSTGGEKQRRANISGAYRVPSPEAVHGKRILLIDDIVTTGSTLSECAKTLLNAGAEEVLCAALARTPAKSPKACMETEKSGYTQQ